MKTLRFGLAALMLAGAGGALAQGADVGLVNMVAGDVRFDAGGGQKPVTAFMKVRQGDRFDLPAGSKLGVIFFASARQERWAGPARFSAGREHSEAGVGEPVEVASLPGEVPQRIARVPDMIRNASLGGIQVRGIAPSRPSPPSAEEASAVAKARATYAKMRGSMPADDITPELFLFSALQDYDRYGDMKVVADEMLRRQPGNEQIKVLADWAARRAAR